MKILQRIKLVMGFTAKESVRFHWWIIPNVLWNANILWYRKWPWSLIDFVDVLFGRLPSYGVEYYIGE